MARVDYERAAAAYHAARGLPPAALAPWREALAAFLSPPARVPVLDVGAGTGQFARAFAEWFEVAVLALEPSAAMRRQARTGNPHPLVACIGGRAEALPLRAHSCACAWLSTVIHHLADLRLCARELRRVLVPGGPVLVRSAFPGHHDRITLFRFFPGARRVAEGFPTVEATAAAFADAGFALVHVADVGQVSAPSLDAMCARVRTHRHADSTLAPLGDDEFERGVRALARAAADERRATPVVDYLTLLVLR